MSLTDLAYLLETPDWMRRAACRNANSDLFFPRKAGFNTVTKKARQICAKCVVQNECLEWALSFPSRYDFGIYAGTNAEERRAIRRKRAA